ncbi:MAG: sensor histidine kinase, partial [Lacrimispora sphenoides]
LVVLPKFTIQPLVENAVKHGFSSQVHDLKIEVMIEPVSNGWHLIVRDNGGGFSNDAISMIYRQFQEGDATLVDHGDVVNTKIGNLGLTNIYIRFRILYGDSFSIDIGNNPDTSGGYIELTVITEV